MNIREEIVAARRDRIKQQGFSLNSQVPEERQVPIVPPPDGPFVICEIKRRSPSKGTIADGIGAVDQAERYYKNGARCFSVLTEENYFGGSLDDLMAVKNRFPHCCVLRKDFLFDSEDIRTSYKAGADAVLLIAGVLTELQLKALYDQALGLGIAPLVEVHTAEDIEKAASVRPVFTGINSRDLTTFTVDLVTPVKIKRAITWPTSLVFESGIQYPEDAAFAASCGFRGLLVGESVVREPERIGGLLSAFTEASGMTSAFTEASGQTHTSRASAAYRKTFWDCLYRRRYENNTQVQTLNNAPLIKICGITREEDLLLADELGADIVGFIFAPSPRRVTPDFIAGLPETRALKVGVYVGRPDEKTLPEEITRLLEDGNLDCIQFHGEELPEQCADMAFPYYKAIRITDEASLRQLPRSRCPRVLIDKPKKKNKSGPDRGATLSAEVIHAAKEYGPLWLAGGIGPDNIAEIIDTYGPELVDAASGLESSPGIKDKEKMERFFRLVRSR